MSSFSPHFLRGFLFYEWLLMRAVGLKLLLPNISLVFLLLLPDCFFSFLFFTFVCVYFYHYFILLEKLTLYFQRSKQCVPKGYAGCRLRL